MKENSCMVLARLREQTPLRESTGGIIILAVFIASRFIFSFMGGAFIAKPLTFAMQYLDPVLLRDDLLQSLFYLHSQPPLFNLMLGLMLKLSPVSALSYSILFKTAGALIPLACYGILSAIGVRRLLAVLVTIVFMLNPTLILYENLLYYSYSETFFIALSLFFLSRWGRDQKLLDLSLFWAFLLCLGLTRSVFHPVFFLVAGAVVTWYLWRRAAAKPLAEAFLCSCIIVVIPLMLLCTKNATVFGFFGTSSWEGMNLWTKVNTYIPEQLEELHAKGIVSTVAIKAELRAFQPITHYVDPAKIPCHTPADCSPTKSTGYPNFNHIGYVTVSRQLLSDALSLIRYEPSRFLFYTLGSYSLTLWHSSDSVHGLFENNMEVLKKLESIYRFLYLGFMGVESKLDARMWERTIVISMLFAMVYISTIILVFKKDKRISPAIMILCIFCLIIHAYTITVSSVIEFGENNRFRFPVDLAFVVMTAGNIVMWRSLRSKRSKIEI
jgi:hypothetical protein